MDALKSLSSTASATVDLLMAAFGLGIVFYPALSVGNHLFGSPLDEATISFVVGILAVGGSYPFVAGDWSLGRLGDYIFAFSASAIAIGLVGAVVIVSFGFDIAGGNPITEAVTIGVAYGIAYLFVFGSIDTPTSLKR